MFDIGFWEIVLCAVIGLVVLGPERLPKAIRTVMRWIYTIRGIANQVKDDLEREIQIKELRREVDQARASGRTIREQIGGSLHTDDSPSTRSTDGASKRPSSVEPKSDSEKSDE
ncbi:Sec-independent protein translocase protein TatB [Celerinatantimonas sp. YJH-8]|uniref:Sec-independent protein translocase protein TatB n=1 Tax=Celerinatantimonas sp. YJH-8 TaxID=3228714 RepID=UPI0038C94DAF